MQDNGVDLDRRRFLTVSTAVVGGIGATATAVPFLASFQPSARALAAGAPVDVDISKLQSGERMTVEWRGKPVWIIKRTDAVLAGLKEVEGELRDPGSDVLEQQPSYAQNGTRSINPSILIMEGVCTHLGCAPIYEPDPTTDLKFGGFFCPCHGSKFDLAGRVYNNVPANKNMRVPQHYFATDTNIVIGEDGGAA